MQLLLEGTCRAPILLLVLLVLLLVCHDVSFSGCSRSWKT
jgi:hypothetical protein